MQSDKVFVIGDVHGCLKTLKSTYKKTSKNSQICFCRGLNR